jgi:hypothetical protein
LLLVLFGLHLLTPLEGVTTFLALGWHFGIMLCISGVLGAALHRANAWKQKADLATKVNHLYDAFRSDKQFLLLLRSFRSGLVEENTYTVRVVEREIVRMFKDIPIPTGRTYKDTERIQPATDDVRDFVCRAARDRSVIAIDGNAENLSLDMLYVISVDSNWKNIFRELSSYAAAITIVPETSKSLTEEINELLDRGHLRKCLFVMPPSDSRPGATRRNTWPAGRGELPIILPSYSSEGALLVFSGEGLLERRLPYTADAFDLAISQFNSQPASVGAALSELESSGVFDDVFLNFERILNESYCPWRLPNGA